MNRQLPLAPNPAPPLPLSPLVPPTLSLSRPVSLVLFLLQTWRLFADASNDIGLALEMLAPLPAFREGGRFLRLICVASVFKAACGVAGGATGAAITEHWAVDNNIADIGAKVLIFHDGFPRGLFCVVGIFDCFGSPPTKAFAAVSVVASMNTKAPGVGCESEAFFACGQPAGSSGRETSQVCPSRSCTILGQRCR